MGKLDGRVALITGGSSGIGLATTRRFQAEGARVAVVDVQPPPPGAGDLFIEGDVSDPAEWPSLVARVEELFGGIDIGYLNAGVTTGATDLESLTDEQYRRIMGVNIDGVVFGARALLPALRRRGGGTIVNTASLAGLVPMPLDSIYSLTKYAVVGFTRSLAELLENTTIRVNAVCPGFTDTPMFAREAEKLRETGFPIMVPDDIAEAVLTAATSEGTGECYVVQPGRAPEPYRFRGVPGPAVAGAEGMAPSLTALDKTT